MDLFRAAEQKKMSSSGGLHARAEKSALNWAQMANAPLNRSPSESEFGSSPPKTIYTFDLKKSDRKR
jgi:hypothetical protein